MVRKAWLAAVALVTTVMAPAPVAARDAVAGLGCGIATAPAGGVQTGVVYGGPVAVVPTYRTELYCVVRVGSAYYDASGAGLTVAVVAAPVQFAAAGEPVDVCTSVEWSILIPHGSVDFGCRRAAYVAGGYLLEPAPVAAGP